VTGIWDKRWWQRNAVERRSETACSDCTSNCQESENSPPWRSHFSARHWEWKGLSTT